MTFPTLDSASNYLKAKLQDFYNQTWVLRDRLRAIAALKIEAQKRNDQETLGKLILQTEHTKQLMMEQLALEQQLKPFADYFNITMTLGALPVILAASAVGVASVLYLHFQKLQNQKTALDLIAKGMLPAAQAEAILSAPLFSFGSGLMGGMTPLLVGGMLLYIMFFKRG